MPSDQATGSLTVAPNAAGSVAVDSPRSSAGVTVTAYSLWAFEMGEIQDGVPWSTISIAPFVMAILRYAVDVDKGAAGAPEEIVLHDRVLFCLGVLWVVTMALGVFDV